MAFWNLWNRRKKKKKAALEKEIQESDNLEAILQEGEEGLADGTSEELSEDASSAAVSPEDGQIEDDEVLTLNTQDVLRTVQECCASIVEIDQQNALSKQEYELVTSRLTDIQRIDRITGEDRESLIEVCKRIIRLTQERNSYKNRSLTITDSQIRRFDRYEDSLDVEVKKMYDAEVYQKAIDSDMAYLQEEKKNLHQEQKEIVERQNALKGMAKILIVLIISLFALFVAIYYALDVDMTYPYLGTILLAAISSTAIFVESNRNRQGIVLVGRKINKAISLHNRVKIKYINNQNMLDYNRDKFHVKDAADFEKQWIEYRRAKDYERKFQENTEQLNKRQELLLLILKSRQVAEPDLWLSQTLAIVDPREMVEIRHALNVQRGKLRDTIAYNKNARSKMSAKIKQMVRENPKIKKEIIALMKKCLTS